MKIGWGTGIGYEQCCALRHAFEHHPEVVEHQIQIHGVDKIRMCKDILTHSAFLTIPERLMPIYGALAQAEQLRLADANTEPLLHCRDQWIIPRERVPTHSAKEHRDALRLFLSFSKPRYSGTA